MLLGYFCERILLCLLYKKQILHLLTLLPQQQICSVRAAQHNSSHRRHAPFHGSFSVSAEYACRYSERLGEVSGPGSVDPVRGCLTGSHFENQSRSEGPVCFCGICE